MLGPEYFKERAQIFAALAAGASNDPMARLYAWMAAEYAAKANGEGLPPDDVPAIILVPRVLTGSS
jgi:hypothetical protein